MKMESNALWGTGLVLVGTFFLWVTKTYPTKKPDLWGLDFKGYLGGGLLLIIGVLMLIEALLRFINCPVF